MITSLASTQAFFSHKLVMGVSSAVKTDATGTMSGTSTPANGVLSLGGSAFSTVFTSSNTILGNADTIIVHEWLVKLIPVSNNQGSFQVWFDIDDTGSATASTALAKNAVSVSCSNTSANAGVVTLRVTSLNHPPYNQAFNPGGNAPFPMVVKLWTDSTTFGAADSTFEFTVVPMIVCSAYGREQ